MSSISFDSIPANLRTPGTYIEINNELANAGSVEFKLLMIGSRLPSGSVAEAVPTLVTSVDQARDFFAPGSELFNALKHMLRCKPSSQIIAIGLDDNPAGAAAKNSIGFANDASIAGTLNVFLAGDLVQVAVAIGDTPVQIAAAIVAAITVEKELTVSATVNSGDTTQVDLVAKNKGQNGNDISVEVYFDADSQPVAPVITVGAFSGGSGNPDIGAAIAVMGDVHYNHISCSYTDSVNLTALATELLDRWGPMRQIGARAFIAVRGTLSATSTFGGTLNSHLITCMGTNLSPQPPYVWAAVNAVVAANSLSIDPARPLQTLILPGIKAPERKIEWTQAERNILLFDGIATYKVDQAGVVRIERQITTYQTNASDLPDASYLDINTPETLDRFRYEQRALIAQRYPNHKLASDGDNYGAGQPVVTPSLIRAQLLALYRELVGRGWVEGYETYSESLLVERDGTDPNRINVLDNPDLVNQLRVYAGKNQFNL